MYVKDIKGSSGFITFQDICNQIGNSPSRILEYNVVRVTVYTFVHRHNVCDTVDPELSDQPLFCNRKINTAKDFRNIYARLCFVCKWLLEQEVWIRNTRTHMVTTIISNERNKATGSTV